MRGFTLIEMIIYLALLGILMTGAILISISLTSGSQQSSNQALTQEEGNFVQRKMSWALTDMSAVPSISGSGCTQGISINKTSYGQNPVVFQRNTTDESVEIKVGGGVATSLTSANVSASCIMFQSNPSECGAVGGISATVTLNNLDFGITKCLRH
jgi:prepilin-type N-terminal cleavage/methylation domain-containing protein